MNRFFISLLAFLIFMPLVAQDSLLIGKKYLEDQLYFNITYNNLINKPIAVKQNGLSLGFHTGFIKDIPLNVRKNLGFGIGLGYDYDKFQTNFIPQKDAEFTLLEENYTKNKFETHAFNIPIEFRYRSSSDVKYKFWRIYVGGKINYIFSSKSVYKDDLVTLKKNDVPHLNKWQYGPYFSIGYNTWNLYAYWNTNKVFEGATTSESLDPNNLSNVKIGLQFYIF